MFVSDFTSSLHHCKHLWLCSSQKPDGCTLKEPDVNENIWYRSLKLTRLLWASLWNMFIPRHVPTQVFSSAQSGFCFWLVLLSKTKWARHNRTFGVGAGECMKQVCSFCGADRWDQKGWRVVGDRMSVEVEKWCWFEQHPMQRLTEECWRQSMDLEIITICFVCHFWQRCNPTTANICGEAFRCV